MNKKNIILAAVFIGIVGSIYVLERQKVSPARTVSTEDSAIDLEDVYNNQRPPCGDTNDAPGCAPTSSDKMVADTPVKPVAPPKEVAVDKSKKYEVAKEISTPDGFINTDPLLTIKSLIGKKVILVDFWTYSCINCQRTQPYLNAWYDKYKDKGLEIIGIHTPEFEFEKVFANVEKATRDAGIKYPVVLDNDYSTWRAYKNQYWPRKYLIDIDGYIVYDHIGEGSYDETERKIQEALEERMKRLNVQGEIASGVTNPNDTIGVDFSKVKSPETYFGSARNDRFGSGTKFTSGVHTYERPKSIVPNTLYFVGTWDIQPEYAEAKSKDAKILYTYDAKNVYVVASAPKKTPIFLARDGMVVGSWVGSDGISEGGESFINIESERLYGLIESDSYSGHSLEITVPEVGVKFFAFTFG
ncbi:MAG: redoxin family protein [Patescibacteria group bacterium]